MIRIRRMSRDDLPLCMALVHEAGWNQIEADWNRAMQLDPEGCFVAESDGCGVGTVTSCLFQQVGWVGMLLVAQSARRRGVGNLLLDHSLHYLQSHGATTIRLDATPLGLALYQRVGFVPRFHLGRYSGIAHASASMTNVRRPRDDDWKQILALDKQVIGYDRSRFLRGFANEMECHAFIVSESGAAQGYLLSRPGNQAVQIGPCVALTPRAGKRLLSRAFCDLNGQPVFADIVSNHHKAIATATAARLRPIREFVRMVRGESVVEDDIDRLWISGGPEKG